MSTSALVAPRLTRAILASLTAEGTRGGARPARCRAATSTKLHRSWDWIDEVRQMAARRDARQALARPAAGRHHARQPGAGDGAGDPLSHLRLPRPGHQPRAVGHAAVHPAPLPRDPG